MRFNASAGQSLGVEVEIGIVDAQTLDLVSASDEILQDLAQGGEHPKAKHEFYSSSLEVITGICTTVADARADLAGTFAEIGPILADRRLQLQPGGAHPSARWQDLTVTDKPRYQEFAEWIRWPAWRSMCHGIHFHVGVTSGDAAVQIARSLAVRLPLFLAVSASSPFWGGLDTGMASSRTKVFEAMPTHDLPAQLSTFEEFRQLMSAMVAAHSLHTVRELWWDIRPHPGFGTVELRICDSMATMRETMALAAYGQCAVACLQEQFDAGRALPDLPTWALQQNKWRAARWGTQTMLITDADGANAPLAELLAADLESLAPHAEQLDCVEELADVAVVAASPGYQRQRETFERSGSLREVTASLVRQWRDDEMGS